MFTWFKNLFKKKTIKETLRYEVTEMSRNGYRTYHVLDVFLGKKEIYSEAMVRSPTRKQIESALNYLTAKHNLWHHNKKQ